MSDHSLLEQLINDLGVKKFRDKILSSSLTKFRNGNLIWLDLGCLGLKQLPMGIFDGFYDLEYLGLYGNALETIPEQFFSNLRKLMYLDIGENSLVQLPTDFFGTENSLQSLWLYSNKFKELSSASFRNLVHLEELNLNSAIKGSIDWGLFKHLPNLKRLEIALNSLSKIPIKKLPKSLQTLVIEKQLPSGGITIVDYFQDSKSKPVQKNDQDTFCLITGLMGSGKSTIMKQLPYQKQDGYPPNSDTELFFDNLFALRRPDGYKTIFYELDGPTILSWDQFISLSDVVVQVIRHHDLTENIPEVMTLAEHILSHKKPDGKFFLAITYFPEDLDQKEIGVPPKIMSQIDELFKIPPGMIRPDVGGHRRVILRKESLVKLCESIFEIKKHH